MVQILNIITILFTIFTIPSLSYADQKKIKVLAILPLSGEMAALGDSGKSGMLLALEKSPNVDLQFEDDSGAPKNTVSALQKHLATEMPSIVITASSGTSKAIAPILENKKIPLIAIATDEEISKNKKYAVNFWVTPDEEARLLIKESLRRGYKNIALFTTIHPGTMSIKRKFTEANNGSLNVIVDEEIAPDLKDFRSIITKFKSQTKNNKIDAIFTNLFFGQIGLFSKQLRELGVKQDLFAIELFEDENEVKASNSALIDQWYIQADDASGEFLKTYSEKFPKSTSFGAANGYDAVMLINKAISEGKSSSEDLNNFIHSVKDFNGAIGVFSSTNDNRFTLPAAVKVVTKDGFKRLE